MSKKEIEVEFSFDRLEFAKDIEIWRNRNDLTKRECDELMGTVNWWSNVTLADTQAYREHYLPRMKLFVDACNLCGLDPRQYFAFSDKLRTSLNEDA